ncbi:DUF6417 family protein [Streptomyces sp. NBC_00203]
MGQRHLGRGRLGVGRQPLLGPAGHLRVSPAEGLAEQARTASCDHGIKRWRLYLTEEQMESVAYGARGRVLDDGFTGTTGA